MEQFKIIDVIQALDPNAQVSIVGNEIASLAWQSTPIPTDILLTKQAEMQAEYDSKQYQRDRLPEYPPATDYLDGIVKGDQGQIDKYIADCLAVKEKFPK